MKKFQQLVSVIVVIGMVGSQIGCAGKVQKISMPIDEIQFDQKHFYTINVKDGTQVTHFTDDDVKVSQTQLDVKTKYAEKKIMKHDISKIIATSKESEGTNALKGMAIGAGTLGVLIGLMSAASASGSCDGYSSTACSSYPGLAFIFGGGIGALFGGLIGLGIGAMIPKHNSIQITPIIEHTTGGVNAGANLGVNF